MLRTPGIPLPQATGDTIYANSTPEWNRLAAGTNGQVLTLASGIPSWATPASNSNALLDGSAHTDTTNSPVTAGDIIYGNNTPAWDDLAIGSEGQVLTVSSSGLPSWANPTIGTNPPWTGDHFPKHHRWIMSDQSSTTMTWGGSVNNVNWVRTSSGTGNVGSTITSYNTKWWYHCGTTSGVTCGYIDSVGGDQEGITNVGNRPVVRYNFAVDYDSGDASSYQFWAVWYNPAGAGTGAVIPVTSANHNCITGTSTVTSAGGGTSGLFGLCWAKNNQANIQICTQTETTGAANGTQNCRDSGVAIPAADTRVDLVLSTEDLSSYTAYISVDGMVTYTTVSGMTANLPTSTGQQQLSFQTAIRTTANNTNIGARIGWIECYYY